MESIIGNQYSKGLFQRPKFQLEWNSLSYSVKNRKIVLKKPLKLKIESKKKMILKPQSGSICSGTVTALMGPSGSGKTTLLNCLSGINQDWIGYIDFLTNGHDNNLDERNIKMKLASVPQKDYHHDNLTVRETLVFAYKFMMLNTDKEFNFNLCAETVDTFATELKLKFSLDNKVSTLSEGQTKRLSVAVELVGSLPDVLILDSGLDSANALMIINFIKNTVTRTNHQMAVICSIHQPSFDGLNIFDQIYLLSENGERIYFNSPLSILTYLSLHGISVSRHRNPADRLIDLCYRNSDEISNNLDHVDDKPKYQQTMFDTRICLIDAISNGGESGTNMLLFVWILIQRNYLLMKNNPSFLISRLLFCMIPFINTFSYNYSNGSNDKCWNSVLNVGADRNIFRLISAINQENGDNIRQMEHFLNSAMAFLLTSYMIILFHSMITGSIIFKETKSVRKEINNNWYTISSYYISKLMLLLTFMAIHIGTYTVILIITPNQLLQLDRLFIITSIWTFLALTSEMVGIIFGTLFVSNTISGIALAILMSFPTIMIVGFVLKTSSIYPMVQLMLTSFLRHI